MSTTWIRVAFGIVLGVVLAVTAGFGVLVFEPGPRAPQSIGLSFSQLNDLGNASQSETNRVAQNIDTFFSDNQTFRQKYPAHQRNIFLWYAGIGIVFAVIGVALPAVVNYLRFGFLTGGLLLVIAGTAFALQRVPQEAPQTTSLLTLISAGAPNGLDAGARFLRFAVALVGLLLLLFTGLWRLTEWPALAARPADTEPPPPPASRAPATEAALPPLATAPAPIPSAPSASDEGRKWARPEERALNEPTGEAIPVAGATTPTAPALEGDEPAAER